MLIPKFVSILTRHVNLKTLMGIRTIFASIQQFIFVSNKFQHRFNFCYKQYVGNNVIGFRNRYIRVHFRNYLRRVNSQMLINNTFISTLNYLNTMGNCGVILIYRADNRKELRRKRCFWQYKLSTFFLHGLNERNVSAEYEWNIYFLMWHSLQYFAEFIGTLNSGPDSWIYP